MPLQTGSEKLVLASGSRGRAMLLREAGLKFDIVPANIDERAIEREMAGGGKKPRPEDVALALARQKALHVSRSHEGALVIGADQVLSLDGEIYEKPSSMEQARENLLKFRGRTHYLHAALSVVLNGRPLWGHLSSAAMTMRNFSGEFLDAYLDEAGDGVLSSVGAYRLEQTGIHLFEKIEGDYFTILGLPMIPLLDFLRERGVAAR